VQWLDRHRGRLLLAAIAAQLLFPVAVIIVVPHLGLGDCPETDAIKARAQQYGQTVIGIESALVVAVAVAVVWWSASRRRRWAWLAVGLAAMVLMGAFSLIVGGLAAINFCNLGLL
jgi:hypothetical protein